MLIGIDGCTVGQEEVRPRFAGNSGLDPGDRLGDGPELEGPDAGGGQERSEDHVVSRRDAHDVVELRIETLHEPAPGPTRTQNHNPRLLARPRGSEAGVLNRRRLWVLTLIARFTAQISERKQCGGQGKWVGDCVSGLDGRNSD